MADRFFGNPLHVQVLLQNSQATLGFLWRQNAATGHIIFICQKIVVPIRAL